MAAPTMHHQRAADQRQHAEVPRLEQRRPLVPVRNSQSETWRKKPIDSLSSTTTMPSVVSTDSRAQDSSADG